MADGGRFGSFPGKFRMPLITL
ncbi:hypothetical protein CO2235_190078 [Cupriavidus oxalaticus]|uniref:Uncharacterized protein n=1 Tax=Cupriavidus oxalaticus TaxID=96344 RepID=A0A976G9T3_9BURK|nr:hypothetical protein CO2235_190078 [Cupriavidus oxalaticus]